MTRTLTVFVLLFCSAAVYTQAADYNCMRISGSLNFESSTGPCYGGFVTDNTIYGCTDTQKWYVTCSNINYTPPQQYATTFLQLDGYGQYQCWGSSSGAPPCSNCAPDFEAFDDGDYPAPSFHLTSTDLSISSGSHNCRLGTFRSQRWFCPDTDCCTVGGVLIWPPLPDVDSRRRGWPWLHEGERES